MYYLDKYINNDKLNLHELIDHEDFISEIKVRNSNTDGGSIQEECFFQVKKPNMRKATERDYALNNNICTNFDSKSL